MRGPFVLLVDLPGGNQNCELKKSRADGTLLARRDAEIEFPRAVDRDMRRSRPWSEVGSRSQKATSLFIQILRSNWRQPRKRHRVNVWRKRVLGPGNQRKRSK